MQSRLALTLRGSCELKLKTHSPVKNDVIRHSLFTGQNVIWCIIVCDQLPPRETRERTRGCLRFLDVIMIPLKLKRFIVVMCKLIYGRRQKITVRWETLTCLLKLLISYQDLQRIHKSRKMNPDNSFFTWLLDRIQKNSYMLLNVDDEWFQIMACLMFIIM